MFTLPRRRRTAASVVSALALVIAAAGLSASAQAGVNAAGARAGTHCFSSRPGYRGWRSVSFRAGKG